MRSFALHQLLQPQERLLLPVLGQPRLHQVLRVPQVAAAHRRLNFRRQLVQRRAMPSALELFP